MFISVYYIVHTHATGKINNAAVSCLSRYIVKLTVNSPKSLEVHMSCTINRFPVRRGTLAKSKVLFSASPLVLITKT